MKVRDFFIKHKKKLLISGAVLGLGVAGIYSYKNLRGDEALEHESEEENVQYAPDLSRPQSQENKEAKVEEQKVKQEKTANGRARLEYDVECFDDKGRQLKIYKAWTSPTEFSYQPLVIQRGVKYTCKAANQNADPSENIIDYGLNLVIEVNEEKAEHPYIGAEFDNEKGEFRFALEDNGTYRAHFTIESKRSDKSTKKERNLEFIVGNPTTYVPEAKKEEIIEYEEISGGKDLLNIGRSSVYFGR